jgi:hypothetical protein
MGMADRTGKRIRGIGTGIAAKLQQASDHFLHLFFFCVTFADDRLLDLQCSVFGNGKIVQHSRANRSAARLPQHQCGFRIDIDKYLLDRDLFGAVKGDHFAEVIHDGLQAQREVTIQGFDATTADVGKFAACLIDDAETRDAQAWVNT